MVPDSQNQKCTFAFVLILLKSIILGMVAPNFYFNCSGSICAHVVEGHAIHPSQNQTATVDMDGYYDDFAWTGSNLPEFPPDVDLEEAKMYEAAHFGIPYNGQLPKFSPPRSPSPETIARRVMVSAQDQEYDESLKTDRYEPRTIIQNIFFPHVSTAQWL